MSLGRYPNEVHGLAEELLDNFSEEQITELYDYLKKIGFRGWREWKQNNFNLIIDYIEATPSKRKKLKKFKNNMPYLAYAAYQQCLAGYCVLQAIDNNYLFPGLSYRGMAAASATAYNDINQSIEHELWPWGGNPYNESA